MTATVERQRALERAMMRVRWFGVALGLYQTIWYVPTYDAPAIPDGSRALVLVALIGLAIVNVTLVAILRGDRSAGVLHRVGRAVFVADIAAVWAINWSFGFEPAGTAWVILSILALEGALRFELWGALAPVAISLPLSTVHNAARLRMIPDLDAGQDHLTWLVSTVSFRIGVLLMIALVAGTIARNLAQERAAAEERAAEMEALAGERERAERESAAFQEVILAGVSEDDLQASLRSMIEAISRALGYERIAVLLTEDDAFSVIALHGFAPGVEEERVRLGQGIVGRVALTKRPEILDDAPADPDYYCVDERTRSQITLPILLGDHVIGILEVESSEQAAFGETDRDRLERLAAQMALVIHHARLLATERATVERLQDLDQMKSDFVAIASHELRTPLTAMQGSIKTLRRRRDIDPSTTEELLAILDRQSDRLTRLVEDLLLASRIDAGRITLRMDRTDLGATVQNVLDQLGAAADRISVAIAANLPAMITDGDRLAQILRNLLENALKFSDASTTVRLTAHATAAGLMLEVVDEGSGIPSDQQERIFERFHQVGGSMRRHSEGLGLGLFITQRLVEALGGTITVESEGGTGSTFRVTIPFAREGSSRSETA